MRLSIRKRSSSFIRFCWRSNLSGQASSSGFRIRESHHLAHTATAAYWPIVYTLANDSTAEVLLYGIDVRYRGLGLFRLLFDGFSRQLGRLRVNRIIFGVPEQNPKLKELFIRHGATPIATAYELTTHQWNTNHANSEQAFL